MLKRLFIENIILVESATIEFGPKFNVLTGETGSGKSAIMQSLGLALGKRADCTMIRRGASRGVVEATFDIHDSKEVLTVLNEAKLEGLDQDELLVRREISAQGKSRSFINDQLVHLSLLREIGPLLLDIVSQNASQSLQSLDAHRHVVDAFGRIHAQRETFARLWQEVRGMDRQIQQLKTEEVERHRRLTQLRQEIEEIESAQILPDEEDELFAEYSRLVNAESIADKAREAHGALSGEDDSILGRLRHLEPCLEEMARLDPSIEDSLKTIHSALVELEDVSYTLEAYGGRLERDPIRMEAVNDRLSLLRLLKRRYGPSLEDVVSHLDMASQEVLRLEQADSQIEKLEAGLQKKRVEVDQEAKALTQRREATARILEQHLTVGVRQLNMPQAIVEVRVTTEARNTFGDDRVEFYLSPNVGEKLISARDCASGGELSRLLLVIKTLLSKKEHVPALMFDEIDANIGGETSALVGEQLKALGKEQQVLCITHFPQVAKNAHHHLKIAKSEVDGRTRTTVTELRGTARQSELTRMLGGQEAKEALTMV